MRVAIAATAPNTEGDVSMHGARAEYYLIYDSVKDSIEAHSNPAAQAERGAGPKAAAYLISQGVEKVVAGQFGPKFKAELESEGIDCIEQTGAISGILTQG